VWDITNARVLEPLASVSRNNILTGKDDRLAAGGAGEWRLSEIELRQYRSRTRIRMIGE
jgi:hypothetical protein